MANLVYQLRDGCFQGNECTNVLKMPIHQRLKCLSRTLLHGSNQRVVINIV